jgi:hypothetical protein
MTYDETTAMREDEARAVLFGTDDSPEGRLIRSAFLLDKALEEAQEGAGDEQRGWEIMNARLQSLRPGQ